MGEECATIPLALHAAAYGWWVAGMVVVRRPGLIFLCPFAGMDQSVSGGQKEGGSPVTSLTSGVFPHAVETGWMTGIVFPITTTTAVSVTLPLSAKARIV